MGITAASLHSGLQKATPAEPSTIRSCSMWHESGSWCSSAPMLAASGQVCPYGLGMDVLAYLLLSALPLLAGYFIIRLAVRHGVMDAHRRLQQPELGRSGRFLP